MKLKKYYAKYLTALLIFATNGIVASRIALSSRQIVLTRTLIGTLFLAAVFLASGQKPSIGKAGAGSAFLLGSGAAMGGSWMLLYEAYRQIGVGIATMAFYCGPVIVMALAPVLFSEKITRKTLLGFLCVVGGMVLMNLGAFAEAKTARGLALGLLSAVMYAVMIVLNRRAEGFSGLENALWQLAGALAAVAAFAAMSGELFFWIEASSLAPVLILGVINTGISIYLCFSSIGRLPVQTVAVLGYAEPLAAVVFAFLILGEVMGPAQLLGGAMIVGGAVAAELARAA
jgi:drug/metabolite transporter (DMT)-like permease